MGVPWILHMALGLARPVAVELLRSPVGAQFRWSSIEASALANEKAGPEARVSSFQTLLGSGHLYGFYARQRGFFRKFVQGRSEVLLGNCRQGGTGCRQLVPESKLEHRDSDRKWALRGQTRGIHGVCESEFVGQQPRSPV